MKSDVVHTPLPTAVAKVCQAQTNVALSISKWIGALAGFGAEAGPMATPCARGFLTRGGARLGPVTKSADVIGARLCRRPAAALSERRTAPKCSNVSHRATLAATGFQHSRAPAIRLPQLVRHCPSCFTLASARHSPHVHENQLPSDQLPKELAGVEWPPHKSKAKA